MTNTATPTIEKTTVAGWRIEQWRNDQSPRVTRAMLGDQLGVDGTAIQKWERRGIKPQDDRIVRILADKGIADFKDWFATHAIYERPLLCTQCDLRSDDPAVRSCSRADCPNVGRDNQAKERIAA